MRLAGWLALVILGGCAATPGPWRQVMVTDEEVTAFVETNWPDFEERVARLTDREGETPSLVAVRPDRCEPYYGAANCWFVVTVRYGDEAPIERSLITTFDREEDGSLVEVILSVHERIR